MFVLTQALTLFIGREKEIADITRLLLNQNCRLVTLTGPGGIGKTRLATEVAASQDHFADGVVFINLEPVQSTELIVLATIDALNLSSGQESPKAQLFSYLREREILLLLDNCEHLLDHMGIIPELLRAAPHVKLLVTSRQALNIQEEWRYPVGGLPYPDDDAEEEPQEFPAVKLFLDRARRVRPDFSFAQEKSGLIRICQLVDGMPLALELAASWTNTLPCGEIAKEIQRQIEFLTTSVRNIPERHRSMQAVFDHTWGHLSEEEQEAFRRLSVFRGGFNRLAAEKVARASLSILSSLVDKSLLQLDSAGRYHMQELLRGYAGEKLTTAGETPSIRDLHCEYFADFLQQRHEGIKGGSQRRLAAEIETELENLREAWEWAVEHSKVGEIIKSADTLHFFYQFQSRYREGGEAFEKAVHALDWTDQTDLRDRALAEILVYQGWFSIRLGRIGKAREHLQRSQGMFGTLGISPPRGSSRDPLTALGTLANIRGEYAEAEKLGEEARQLHEGRGDKGNLMDAYYVLTNAAFAQGKYEVAWSFARQAQTLAREINDRWMLAYILNDLGSIARALRDYEQARMHYEESYHIKEGFGDSEGMAAALNLLGKIALLQENYEEGKSLFLRSQKLYEKIGDRGGLATSLNGLGSAFTALGDYPAAQAYYQRALRIATEIKFLPLTLAIINEVAVLCVTRGLPERGIELLARSLSDPASDHETKTRAESLLSHYEEELPENLFARAKQTGERSELSEVVQALQMKLARGSSQAGPETIQPGIEPPLPPQPIVEPLTRRELEVLQLIAEGLTNQQIAKKLIISIGTVKWYASQIYSKLDVNSRTQAIARARELDLLD